jgi:aryl-alcohol dehydrogenase-like predicted oxidoreductase
MNFGWYTDEAESFKIMDAALDAGINFFDTANSYGGGRENRGLTEEIIGRAYSYFLAKTPDRSHPSISNASRR